MNQNERNGLQEIIDNALAEMAEEMGEELDLSNVNLAVFCKKTGLTRSKARTLKKKGFKVTPHGRCGMKAKTTVLTGFTDTLDNLLHAGITNSSVCFERIRQRGYEGGLTTVKGYIAAHKHLVPAKRRSAVEPQGNRGRRYRTKPGESYQMDWGFVNVVDWLGNVYRVACFAMICHHCGTSYVEFFPNARQENLFIGMIHAFMLMDVPQWVLTDNMKSVVLRRDAEGKPVWQSDYAAFMSCIGFKTRLCKPRHPFTKGKVERLIRFVKDNFLAGRTFNNVTELNSAALEWCSVQGSRHRRAVDCIPLEEHAGTCAQRTAPLAMTEELSMYLCPRRKISFDGFVNYEGRRFGVPYWYEGGACRVNREGRYLHIYSEDLSRELVAHEVTWSRRDSFCEHQYSDSQPEELPSATVTTTIAQIEPPTYDAFSKFAFGREL